MTREELRARILDGLDEDPDDPVFWSAAQVNASLEEAREVLAEEAGSTVRTAFVVLEPGQHTYRLSAIAPDVMAPFRLWLVAPERRLHVVSMADLDRHALQWRDTEREPMAWFPIAWDTFGVYPRGSGLLRVDYLAWPRELLDDGDRPEGPASDAEAIVLYGRYDGELKRWHAQAAADTFAQFRALWGDQTARAGVQRGPAEYQRGEATGAGLTRGLAR